MSRLPRLFLFLACWTLAAIGTAASETAEEFRTAYLAGKLTWQDVLDRARKEGSVRFFYWGGNDVLNVWMDSQPGQAMAELGIKMVSDRLTETRGAVDLVIEDKSAGKTIGQGGADLIWLNGENFLELARRDLLFGAFAQSLPNSKNFDWNAKDARAHPNFFDFGTPIGNREIPWSGEQYVCAVNRASVPVDKTPASFADFKTYLQANPGSFSYISPPAEAGTTFVLAALYAFSPDGHAPFQKSAKELGADELARLMTPGLTYLKSLSSLLLTDDRGEPRYLDNSVTASRLFREGRIHFTCEFGTYRTATRITTGRYPATAEAMIFPKANMIKNKNYLAIPGNASNPAAALVLANYLASVEAQASKLGFVGYPPGIDLWMLNKQDAQKIRAIAPPHIGVTQEELDANAVPDANATLVEIIATVWRDAVLTESTEPIDAIVKAAFAAHVK